MKKTDEEKMFDSNAGQTGLLAKIARTFRSPISSMSGTALFIIAGSRLSFAISAAGALLWVFIISAFVNTARRGIASKVRNRMFNVILSSFSGSLYFFLLYLLNPLLAVETCFICALAPVFFAGSKFCSLIETSPADAVFQEALYEPLSLAGLTLGFSLIREPLGFATLSIPGGKRGIIELFNTQGGYSYPVQMISSSTGALFLLAYIIVISRYIDKKKDFSL
ncbi:MAG: hypothetical protein LBB47_00180 [Spirochaetaceae bacterium]|jgi:hypothetical protein|nr:hypothetical protein [Spirochaetaceae bacterium]